MAEYIDRNLCEIVAEYDQYYKLVVPLEKIRKMPAADVAEVRHGRWEMAPYNGVYDIRCSSCGYCPGIRFYSSNYCPNCGALMREVENGEK